MALLYHWRREVYARDVAALVPGADLTFEQSAPVVAAAPPDATLWAFTRRADRRYVLAAHVVMAAVVDQDGRDYQYGRCAVRPLPGRTVLYDAARGDDLDPLIRALPVRADAAVLGHSLQGPAAVPSR